MDPLGLELYFILNGGNGKKKKSKEKYIRAPTGLLYFSFNKRKLDERILINRFTDSANWAAVSCVANCSQRIDWKLEILI